MSTRSTTVIDRLSNLLSDLSLASPPTSTSQSLSRGKYTLLLTPYLHIQPLHLKHITEPIDPFESFGRSLSYRYANIRHAPYVAGYGIAGLHKHLLDEAQSVIVVLCSTTTVKGVRSSQRLDRVEDQERFAEGVFRYITDKMEERVLRILLTIDVRIHVDMECYDEVFNLKSWDELGRIEEVTK
jgi:hypothetical protein